MFALGKTDILLLAKNSSIDDDTVLEGSPDGYDYDPEKDTGENETDCSVK